jgi:hypothetical protein
MATHEKSGPQIARIAMTRTDTLTARHGTRGRFGFTRVTL